VVERHCSHGPVSAHHPQAAPKVRRRDARLILLGLCALASGAPSASKTLFTPLARGGGRIVGGEAAEVGEFPHQIALLYGGVGGDLMCGGSLVQDTWVVTAGHCCDGMNARELAVSVGSHGLHHFDDGQEDIPVKTVVLHENYDSFTVENDICLLELESAATMSDTVATIALPSNHEEYEAGTMCTVTGWGAVSEGGHLANKLQKVEVPVVSDADCRSSYGQEDITDSMICAGLDEGGKDSCQGDSGGPMICGNTVQLSGVVSWGYGCAEAGYPGVYTQTSYFRHWLNQHMNA